MHQGKSIERIVAGQRVKVMPWEDTFLAELAATGNVAAACRKAAISVPRVYSYRKKNPHFAAQMQDAKDEALETLEAEAYRRAKVSSDTLLIFLLKAHNPDRYRDQLQLLNGFEAAQLKKLRTVADAHGISPDELLDKMLERFGLLDG